MPLPEPEPGLVIGYSYLRRHEHRRGAVEGANNRPCGVVVVVKKENGDTEVWVAPITHRRPEDPERAVEFPPRVKRHLGLDDAPSWIIADEMNVFVWPGPDLRPIDGSASEFAYGFLPPKLFDTLKARMVEIYERSQGGAVRRE